MGNAMYRADNWFTLEDVTPNANDYENERALNWAAGTFEVLRYVRRLALDRYTGWHCPNKPRFIDAGRVYKRGVAVNTVAKLPSSRFLPIEIMLDPNSLVPYFSGDRFIVVDDNALPVLKRFIASGIKIRASDVSLSITDVNEMCKSLGAVTKLLDKWRQTGQKMRWTAVGGGVITDVCAFAASCVGARIDLVPTTLLAMVDAAIGGKNGVNSEFGKNQIGSYYFPNHIAICPYWLATLPKEEIFAGSWECIKMALIAGDQRLVDQWLSIIESDPNDDWIKLIGSTIEIKSRFVGLDPFEIKDRRQLLNLGHTLGHALEAVALLNSNNKLRHGEAVGVGLIYALLLSKKLGKLSIADDLLLRLRSHRGLLSKQQLAQKIKVDDLNDPALWSTLLSAISHDKKRRGEQVPWIVMQDQRDIDGFCAELVLIDDQQLLVDCWQQLLKVLS